MILISLWDQASTQGDNSVAYAPATFNEDFTVRVDEPHSEERGDSDEDKLEGICMSKSPETQRQ